MRLIFGIIVGIALTIGGAYMHDSPLPSNSNQRVVNWDVAGSLAGWAAERVRVEWDRLTAK
jgi:hypothetical protein